MVFQRAVVYKTPKSNNVYKARLDIPAATTSREELTKKQPEPRHNEAVGNVFFRFLARKRQYLNKKENK
jgi:hypothetical protein